MTEDLTQQPEGGLLQSRGWAVFGESTGETVVALTQRAQPIFGIVRRLPVVGRYLYVPRGTKDITRHNAELQAAAQRYKCVWVRIEPLEKIFDDKDFVKAPHDMQPRCVLQMNIMPQKDVLLAQMKSKTRYNIRIAQKRGVDVRVYRHDDDGATEALQTFINLVSATAQRKGVHFHAPVYYKKMFAHVKHDSGTDIILYTAVYKEEIIAANLVTICSETATYLHGASSDAYRNVMAPFLLQWRQIIDAQKRGCKWYDFGGYFIGSTDPGKIGISRFKKGFAPKAVPLCLLGTYDLPLMCWRYTLYRVLERIKYIAKKCRR